jgi:transcriptional regulator with XRE-family HTH domain
LYVDFLYSSLHFCYVKKDILKKFGDRVRELRLQNNWTQEDLSDQTGFHRTYIGMVERGERNLSLKNIETFAKTFGMSLSELLNF